MLKCHFVSCQQLWFPKCERVSLWGQRPGMQSCQWISQTNSSAMRLICCTARSDPMLLADGRWFSSQSGWFLGLVLSAGQRHVGRLLQWYLDKRLGREAETRQLAAHLLIKEGPKIIVYLFSFFSLSVSWMYGQSWLGVNLWDGTLKRWPSGDAQSCWHMKCFRYWNNNPGLSFSLSSYDLVSWLPCFLWDHRRPCCWSSRSGSTWCPPARTPPAERHGNAADWEPLPHLPRPQRGNQCAGSFYLFRFQSQLDEDLLQLLVHKVDAELLESVFLKTVKNAGWISPVYSQQTSWTSNLSLMSCINTVQEAFHWVPPNPINYFDGSYSTNK